MNFFGACRSNENDLVFEPHEIEKMHDFIKGKGSTDAIPSDLKVVRSPGDGQCIIHCFSQRFHIDSSAIFQLLEKEFRKNMNRYLQYSDDMTEEELLTEFVEYQQLRRYNLSIVDLVLEALSKIFNCQLIIFEKTPSGYRKNSMIGEEYDDTIYLKKNMDHYDLLEERIEAEDSENSSSDDNFLKFNPFERWGKRNKLDTPPKKTIINIDSSSEDEKEHKTHFNVHIDLEDQHIQHTQHIPFPQEKPTRNEHEVHRIEISDDDENDSNLQSQEVQSKNNETAQETQVKKEQVGNEQKSPADPADVVAEQILYHQEEKRLPIYKFLKPYGSIRKKEMEALMKETFDEIYFDIPNKSRVCEMQPRKVQNNIAFFVDTTKLADIEDLLADDCGSWRHYGQRKFFYCMHDNNTINKVSKGGKYDPKTLVAIMSRVFYFNKNATDFRRLITYVETPDKKRLDLTKVEYQFESETHEFQLRPHGNSKKRRAIPYNRTQKSTMKSLERELTSCKRPCIVVDTVSEENGGIDRSLSAASLPRNISQVYNLKKNLLPNQSDTDPYQTLVLKCKEQAKSPSTAFIRKVVSAPEPMAIFTFDQQLKEIEKYCTNPQKFGVFQADPTFNLGEFSVTTTTYEHLLLVTEKTKTHPAMLGPLLVHQKKLLESYKCLTNFLEATTPNFHNLCCIGTDGEINLSQSFKEACPNAIHLLCFLHFKRNLKDKMKKIGISEQFRKQIIADIFGQQIGEKMEEGIVDSESSEEFFVKLESLKLEWLNKMGRKGDEFHKWFSENKANQMSTSMVKPIRIKAGLGIPSPKEFTTNRVESVNQLLKLETDNQKHDINTFATKIEQLVRRQQKNVRWSIIGKGPYKLHPNLSHLQIPEDEWYRMNENERQQYQERVFSTDVLDVIDTPNDTDVTIPYKETDFNLHEETSNFNPLDILAEVAGDHQSFSVQSNSTTKPTNSRSNSNQSIQQRTPSTMTSGKPYEQTYTATTIMKDNHIAHPHQQTLSSSLSLISNLKPSSTTTLKSHQISHQTSYAKKTNPQPALSSQSLGLSVSIDNFIAALQAHPRETALGIYNKAVDLRNTNGVVNAPGCHKESKMVASASKKDRPHLVAPGKANGEYKCERSCPHYNAMKICSHCVITAELNGKLRQFLDWFSKKGSKKINLTCLVRTDMPTQPGAKKAVQKNVKRLPIKERVSRFPNTQPYINTNSFFVKKMNNKITVCQGCRGAMTDASGNIPTPPYNYCVARKEKRSFRGQDGKMRTAAVFSDSHYHLQIACIKAVESLFDPKFLVVTEDTPKDICNFILNTFY